MERTNQNLFVDVWIGFHVLFLSVLAFAVLIQLNVFEPTSSIIVKGPLGLTMAVVVVRFSLRHLTSLFERLNSVRRFLQHHVHSVARRHN